MLRAPSSRSAQKDSGRFPCDVKSHVRRVRRAVLTMDNRPGRRSIPNALGPPIRDLRVRGSSMPNERSHEDDPPQRDQDESQSDENVQGHVISRRLGRCRAGERARARCRYGKVHRKNDDQQPHPGTDGNGAESGVDGGPVDAMRRHRPRAISELGRIRWELRPDGRSFR